MPPDMREWLSSDDPVWLIIDAVTRIDTGALHAQRRTGGAGRAGYDPDMLLTLLIWGWSQGQRSSRTLERLCHRDVSYRIICAGDVPDHVTISRFRAACTEVVEDLFTQVLMLCARLGMGELGVVALDGVKIGADASLKANRSEDSLRKALQEEAREAAEKHQDTDAAEDRRYLDDQKPGGQVPADPRQRRVRLEAALAEVQAERDRQEQATAEAAQRREQKQQQSQEREQARAAERAQLAAEIIDRDRAGQGLPGGRLPVGHEVEILTAHLEVVRARQQAKVDAWEQLPRSQRCGRAPGAVDGFSRFVRARKALERAQARADRRAAAAAEAHTADQIAAAAAAATPKRDRLPQLKRNTTDPQSRPMPQRGNTWIQGYNCQAVTSSDGLIIATSTSNNSNDTSTFIDMLGKAVTAAKLIDEHRPAPDSTATAQTGDDTPATTSDPGGIGILLADAGYLSEENLTAEGPDRLIAVGTTHSLRRQATDEPTTGPPPPEATPIQAMAHRLATTEGHALYSQRSHIAETPFGHTKHNLGFRRFTGRGLARASADFTLNALVNNLVKAITGKYLATT